MSNEADSISTGGLAVGDPTGSSYESFGNMLPGKIFIPAPEPILPVSTWKDKSAQAHIEISWFYS